MSLSFAALDVETANSARGSICSVGVAVVRDGHIVGTEHWLCQPPPSLGGFETTNTRLHGLRAADVADQPSFAAVLPQVLAVIGQLPVVAHHASFDIGALRSGCDAERLSWPTLTYACSLTMARRAGLGLLSYRLPFVCAALDVPSGRHHHAGDDANSAAGVVLALAARQEAGSLDELAASLMVRLGRITHTAWASCVPTTPVPEQRTAAAADPDHPLYGRAISFTGGLSITRAEAAAFAVELGATVQASPTRTTDFLVIGDGFTGHRAQDFHTGRAAKAVKVNAKGGRVEVLTEGNFLELLAERSTTGTRPPTATSAAC
jgi:DNA polymerase-3 subunit epsilon